MRKGRRFEEAEMVREEEEEEVAWLQVRDGKGHGKFRMVKDTFVISKCVKAD